MHFQKILDRPPLLTVIFDLVVAIEAGVVVSALLFMKRMAEVSDIKFRKYMGSSHFQKDIVSTSEYAEGLLK